MQTSTQTAISDPSTSMDILVNEVQLGSQLANAVTQKRSNDFALLLAMMSHNVLDNAQFTLPSESAAAEEVDEAKLRQMFGLAAVPCLSINEHSATQSTLLGVDLHTEGLSEIKLKGYLNPEPLARHNDAKYIEPHVIDNCDLVARSRHERGVDCVSTPFEHNPAALYEVLQELHKAA